MDLIIRNGMVIDGSGLPRRRIDVGIDGGRVVALGHLDGVVADDEIDAAGLIVAPGIVDPHTHYDPQITFDPYATTSCFHGVTSVVAGNCGFSVAPVKAEDREFLSGIFARVENMDPIALSAVSWESSTSVADFFGALEGRLGVNFACYVGHSNLRRWVMGEAASERVATADEIEAMCRMLGEALDDGAAGLSSSTAPTQLDLDDRPIPSRLASSEELAALASEAGRRGRGSIGFLPFGGIGGLSPEEMDQLIELGSRSGLPVIIQGLGGRNKVDAPTATWEASKEFLDRATELGAPVYSMLITRPFDKVIRIDHENYHFMSVRSWHDMLHLDREERLARLRDPAARDEMRHAVENYNRDPELGTTIPPPQWSALFVHTVAHERNRALQSRSIADIAEEQGKAPADAMLDLALDEDLETEFRWRTETAEWAAAVRDAQLDARMVIGVSDGGAHLARDDGSDWSSYFLGSWVRDRKVWTLEEGIRQITQMPAALVGLHDRGTIRVGGWADLMIFDEAEIGPSHKEFVRDLPGGVGRFKAWGTGVRATIVNGVPIVLDGELTDALPGHVLRPS